MQRTQTKRQRKLVNRDVQLRMAAAFAGFSLFTLMFQFVLFTSVMTTSLAEVSSDFTRHFDLLVRAFLRTLVLSGLVILPISALLGVVTSFRIAGPLYRITRYLEGVRAGEEVGDLRLRKEDHYQDLGRLVNDVTGPLRRGQVARAPGASPEPAAALPGTSAEVPEVVEGPAQPGA